VLAYLGRYTHRVAIANSRLIGIRDNVFKRMFDAVSDEPDMEYAMVDATIVRVHRHGQGAKGGLKARLSASLEAA